MPLVTMPSEEGMSARERAESDARALRAERGPLDDRNDAHETGFQAVKAAQIAAVISRYGATKVFGTFTAPIWRMVIALAEVSPHSADEPVSATVVAIVGALLQAQSEGTLAFGAARVDRPAPSRAVLR